MARIIELRKTLLEAGDDAGLETIVWHLAADGVSISPSTVARVLTRAGLVVPQPRKRPRSSWGALRSRDAQ